MITAKEASGEYNISRATINLWRKKGILKQIENTFPAQYHEEDILNIINLKNKCCVCGDLLIKISHNKTLCKKCKNQCAICKVDLINNRCSWVRLCIACSKTYGRLKSKKARNNNPLKIKEAVVKSEKKFKLQVFQHYCKNKIQCAKCAYEDIRALSIDHMNGEGYLHLNEKGNRLKGKHLYRWLFKNNFPTGFQVLCMNCQFIKRHENKENSKYKNPSHSQSQ
jgi:hypothetical protein